MISRVFIFLISLAAAIVTFTWELTMYEVASVFLFFYFLLSLIDSIGKSYDLLTVPILLLIFECLIMPSVVYNVYNDDSLIAALRYNMAVPKEDYFSFVFPGTVAMILGMRIPLLTRESQTAKIRKAVNACREYLRGKGNLGILLIIIGSVSGILEVFTPSELKYVLYLFGRLIIVGVFYIFYSDFKDRKLYVIGAILFIFAQSLAAGMFGDLVYTFLLGGMLIALGIKIKGYQKYLFATVGFVLILLIQSVKSDYRAVTWTGEEDQQNTKAFLTLIADRLATPSRFFDLDMMFPIVNRFNQGMIVAKVIDYVPRFAPFADGETIYGSIASTFVPRILWPNKPMAGGHYNMRRFTGFEIVGYSMNTGVIGEAYGNFGRNGGIFFMFLYGLFFNVIFYIIVTKSNQTPTLILWIPFIYLNAIQAESDTLMTINSTIKNILFLWFCYWAADRFLRLKL
ncbi:hypothetical protein WG954_07555 [Lacibacter sp. H375]|uniref:hypothetical protein n=1 Tax=Lacibacter sp. H375 TaxID=3133424 RepID=UPI0030BFE14D